MGWRHPHKPSDYPNFLLYVLDETHVTVTATTALVLLYTRDAHVAWFAIGAVGASQLAKGIKLLIREPRPPAPPPMLPSDENGGEASDSSTSPPNRAQGKQTRPKRHPVRPKKTYGMPSTHSTALTFFWAYLLPLIPTILAAISGPSSSLATGIAQVTLTVMWAAGLWSRRELGYHTWAQIIVGAGVGMGFAAVWRGAWEGLNGARGLGVVGMQEGLMLRDALQGLIDGVWGATVGRVLA